MERLVLIEQRRIRPFVGIFVRTILGTGVTPVIFFRFFGPTSLTEYWKLSKKRLRLAEPFLLGGNSGLRRAQEKIIPA